MVFDGSNKIAETVVVAMQKRSFEHSFINKVDESITSLLYKYNGDKKIMSCLLQDIDSMKSKLCSDLPNEKIEKDLLCFVGSLDEKYTKMV